jgi:hypothetical protein
MNKDVLVHLGGGMGNMLMATPMIEMLSRGGYPVDVCLQGETPNVDTIFHGWRHARTVASDPGVFTQTRYGYYIFGDEVKGAPIAFPGRDEAVFLHPLWDWQIGFDLHSEIEMFTNIARAIDAELPLVTQTSCSHSGRVFDEISEKTCVLIPGGQKQMPIRKWPYYGAMAEHMKDVAVVGVPSDLDLANRIVIPKWVTGVLGKTLSHPGTAWRVARHLSERYDDAIVFPPHAKNYVGKLTLADTAALISQAGYVIGNDCGLTHLAVALGKPTFAVIGPTSRRKVFPAFLKNVRVISLAYECQPCQEKRELGVWRESPVQCFCPFRLRCMNDLTAEAVLQIVRSDLLRDAPSKFS